jgi:uncharacterized membrane protein YhdT
VNSTVNLSFRYLESDYVRALRAHHRSRLRLPLDIVAVVVLAALGAYEMRSTGMHWLGVTCLTISVLFVLLLIAAFTIIPSLVFRTEPKFRDDYSLTFSPEGIHFRTAHIDSHLQWSIYSSALVDAYSYVLYWGSRQFTVVPKRVFQSAEQKQEFEQLLAQNITSIVRKDS